FDRAASREGAAALLDQPQSRRGENNGGRHDSVELNVLEQEHALNEIVVGRAGSTQHESEQCSKRDVEDRHTMVLRQTNRTRYSSCVVTMPPIMKLAVATRLGHSKL